VAGPAVIALEGKAAHDQRLDPRVIDDREVHVAAGGSA